MSITTGAAIPLDSALISITLTLAVESYVSDEQRTAESDKDMAFEAVMQALNNAGDIKVLGHTTTLLSVQALA